MTSLKNSDVYWKTDCRQLTFPVGDLSSPKLLVLPVEGFFSVVMHAAFLSIMEHFCWIGCERMTIGRLAGIIGAAILVLGFYT